MRKLIRALPAAVMLLGVLLVWSGVSMMEQTATDIELYPYIARAFCGLALTLAGAVTLPRTETGK